MEDHPQHNRKAPLARQPRAVDALASKALDQLASRADRDAMQTVSVARAVELMHDAAMDADSTRLIRLRDQLLRLGLSPVDLSEQCIPAVARLLGDQWCEDELGFAGVTIGCARLTSMLRAVDLAYSPEPPITAPQILVLVGDDVYHTLGATVLSGILRRAGLCTQLWIGAEPATLAQHLDQAEFDAVFISASIGETLESVRLLVSTAKMACPTIPIVVGGTIIEDVGSPEEVQTLTGATLVTNNPYEAIKLCETTEGRPPAPTPRSIGQTPNRNGI